MQAMQLSKTSNDKTWNQMTPFERAKIKTCFEELLRDMSKNERRAGLSMMRGSRYLASESPKKISM